MSASKSWSQFPSEMVEVTHVMTIDNFSLRNDKIIYSPNFSSSKDKGKEWTLKIYPNGDEESNKTPQYGYYDTGKELSLFVTLISPGENEVEVNYCFYLYDEKGTCIKAGEKSKKTFSKTSTGWGYSKFCKRDEILKKLTNNVLKLACQLSYLKVGACVITTDQPAAPAPLKIEGLVPADKLSDNYGTLLTDSEYSDVTLSIGKTEFKAHRAILVARSPYFSALFKNANQQHGESGDTKKPATNNMIEIKEVKPEIFKEILGFIYTGKVSKNMSEPATRDLLAAANKFTLPELKKVAENALISKLCIENAFKLLVLAETHSAQTLKTKATDFVATNMKQVVDTLKTS